MTDISNGPDYACEHGTPLDAECALCGEDEIADTTVQCPQCGRPTSIDAIYGNLCYRCCRAANE